VILFNRTFSLQLLKRKRKRLVKVPAERKKLDQQADAQKSSGKELTHGTATSGSSGDEDEFDSILKFHGRPKGNLK